MKRSAPLKPSKILPRRELSRSTPLVAKSIMRKSRGKRRELAVRSNDWLDHVRSIEFCVLCGKAGVEAAHRDEGKGMSQKTDDVLTAALCPGCHAELGNGNKYSREERRCAMDKAIVETLKVLARDGKVGAL